MFAGYRGMSAFVKQNHDTFASADQNLKLSIQSQQKTWSSFAEAYEATARDFEITSPKYILASIIDWHLSYERSKLHNEREDFSQDPLILCLEPPGVLPDPGVLPAESHASSSAHVQSSVPSSYT